MYSTRQELISQSTEQLLIQHGFTLNITSCITTTEKYKEAYDQRWDKDFYIILDKEIDLVDGYSDASFIEHVRKTLKLEKLREQQVIWLPVFKKQDTDKAGFTYSTEPFDNEPNFGITGFIYATKKQIRERYKIGRMYDCIRSATKSYLKASVTDYTAWVNDDIYTLEVVDAEGTNHLIGNIGHKVVMGEFHRNMNIQDEVDVKAQSIIRYALRKVNYDATPNSVDISINIMSPIGMTEVLDTIYLNTALKSKMGFMLNFGNVNYSKDGKTLNTRVSLDALPPYFFKMLPNYCREGVREKREAYSQWEYLAIHSVLASIINSVEGFTLRHVGANTVDKSNKVKYLRVERRRRFGSVRFAEP